MRVISGKLKGKKILLPKDKLTRPLRDLVKESKHTELTVNPRRPDIKRQARGIGTVIDIIVKKNKAGQRHFYYSVLWKGTSTESTHSQMRLKPAEA